MNVCTTSPFFRNSSSSNITVYNYFPFLVEVSLHRQQQITFLKCGKSPLVYCVKTSTFWIQLFPNKIGSFGTIRHITILLSFITRVHFYFWIYFRWIFFLLWATLRPNTSFIVVLCVCLLFSLGLFKKFEHHCCFCTWMAFRFSVFTFPV